VEAKIEAELMEELDTLQADGIITQAENQAVNRHMATANDHGSWIWHFNHMHASFMVNENQKSNSTITIEGPWPDIPLNLQAVRAREYAHTQLPKTYSTSRP